MDAIVFNANQNPYIPDKECDFDKEHGKVHLKSHFIMNGVCVRFRGWLDLDRLDGVGCLEYDERRAMHEDAILRDQIECYNRQLRQIEDSKRVYRDVNRQEEMEAVRRGIATGATRISLFSSETQAR
uniref:Protein big brother n=1 Tax=Megaselia scalaris TaxID=36166 RepID=T1GFI7_MEGSC